MVHKNGVEIGCDLFGKFVHIVIDMDQEIGNAYQIEICSLAVLGYCDGDCDNLMEYERDGTVPEAIEVIKGGFPVSLTVEDIYPVPESVNFVAGLRQKSGAELAIVTLEEEQSGETLVRITALGQV